MNVDIVGMLDALGIRDYKLQGDEVWAPCPYPGHDERTPSWSIKIDKNDPRRNGYNSCFGCKEGGGPVHLVKEILGLSSYSSAKQWLTENNLDLDNTPPLKTQLVLRRPTLDGCFALPDGVSVRPLESWNSVARQYAESRGITPRQVERWGLGVGVYGSTKDRIIFPVYNADGQLLNWTARAYAGQERWVDPDTGRMASRYKNPTNADSADMSAVFGEQFWPAHPARDTLVICEGAINALACERAGARYVAALGGSRLDKRQVLKMSRFGRITLAVDMDNAGSKIAKQLKMSLARWSRVHRVEFPDGEDPADIAVRSLEELRELLQWQAHPV